MDIAPDSSLSDNPRIGLIGLGLMGTALAARLIAAGFTVTGFDIDAARCAELRRNGGIAAMSASDVFAHCRTIVLALFDASQIEAVLHGLAPSVGASGTVMICITTCAPEDIASLARRAADHGFFLIEAPISGTSKQTRNGSALALIAGEPRAIETVRAVLDALCPRQIFIGNIGDASRTKLAINLILQNTRAALAEGIAFAESMGLNAEAFLAAARQSAAYSSVMDAKGEKMLVRDFTPQSHIAQTLKDAELILDEGRRRGQSLPVTTVQVALLRTTIALLGGEVDSAAIVEAIRPSSRKRGSTR
jgi:3-hydroxyisobutyrate dehydrogenase-like beta-hydroxyacid dehydrogenase